VLCMSRARVNSPNWPPVYDKKPRTEAEIDEVLQALRSVWLSHPGMRLTQIVTAIAKVDPENYNKEIKYDHTYVEDQEWMEKAARYPYF
jgi:hypothetical protein